MSDAKHTPGSTHDANGLVITYEARVAVGVLAMLGIGLLFLVAGLVVSIVPFWIADMLGLL
jgi:hypothetical protein